MIKFQIFHFRQFYYTLFSQKLKILFKTLIKLLLLKQFSFIIVFGLLARNNSKNFYFILIKLLLNISLLY